MSFDADFAADIAELIGEEVAGQVTVLRSTTTADPSKPNRPGTVGPPDEYPVPAMFTLFELSQVDDTNVQRNDQMVHIDPGALAIEPTTDDQVVIDGATREIVNVDIVKPGATALLYSLHVR